MITHRDHWRRLQTMGQPFGKKIDALSKFPTPPPPPSKTLAAPLKVDIFRIRPGFFLDTSFVRDWHKLVFQYHLVLAHLIICSIISLVFMFHNRSTLEHANIIT